MTIGVDFHLRETSPVRIHRWKDGHVSIAIHGTLSEHNPQVTLYLPSIGAAQELLSTLDKALLTSAIEPATEPGK